ncbi:MAG: O-antigen ligase family protein [Actinobacteria bacterium]|nr:O-antigen ligase family protein [Actinomycetota bacterium]
MDLIKSKLNFFIQFQLKLLMLFTMLFVYKYIYLNRINQETFLRLFVIILLFLWFLKLMMVDELSWEKTKLTIPILLFILGMSLSLTRKGVIFIGLKDYINFLAYFIIFFSVINFVSTQKEFNSFIRLFFLISFLVSLYTLIQYYGIDLLYKKYHGLTSTLGQKNWISNYIAMVFPVIFSFFLLQKHKKVKTIYYILLSILYINIMICQSRGIWISIFLSFILGLYLINKLKLRKYFRKNRKWLTLLVITLLIITVIYSTSNPLNKSAMTVVQRAATTFDKNDVSINTRLLIWKNTLNMIKDHPWLGSGIGTFKLKYQNYQADYLQENPGEIKYWIKAGEAHNEYLQIWAELGIIGLFLFLIIIYFFYDSIIKFLNEEEKDNVKDNKENKIIVVGMLTGITCFLIHALFSFPLHVPALGAAFFMMFGLTLRFTKGLNSNKENQLDITIKSANGKNNKYKIIFTILILSLAIFLINSIVVKPYISELYYFKGMIFNLNYKFRDSLPLLSQAANLSPHNGRIVHALGATYYNLNRYDEAIDCFNRAKQYEIDKYTFYLSGLSYFSKGMYYEAEKEFKYAIYLEPKFTESYIDLAYLYAFQKDYDKAIIEWNKVLGIETVFSEKYNVLYFIGLTYNKKEMPDKALEYFLQALVLVPEGDPIEKEIEEEINKIYKSKLEK